MGKTQIEWTDITANPIHLVKPDGKHGGHWCRKISPACAHCYAEAMNLSKYFIFASGLPYTGQVPDNLVFSAIVMEKLMKMKKGERVFAFSMTDCFGDWVRTEWLDLAFAYMVIASQHTFQILTKRPERMPEYFRSAEEPIRKMVEDLRRKFKLPQSEFIWPIPNLWIGTTVENQKTAHERIPHLLETPAVIRFLSCEPLLECVSLDQTFTNSDGEQSTWLDSIDQVIIGGESGPGARGCELNWIRFMINQCQRASDVAIFVKQLGSNPIQTASYIEGVATTYQKLKLKDKKGGTIDEFPEDLRIREFPTLTASLSS
jgi:protein gp37